MKKLVICLVLVIVTQLVFAQDNIESIVWETDFELAKSKSQKSQKPILMLFTGSDWCAPCKMLKANFFDSSEFIKMSNNFIMLMVDFPKDKALITHEQEKLNTLLSAKYGVKSFPTLIAINYDGAIIDKIKSYSSVSDTVYYFSFINKLIL